MSSMLSKARIAFVGAGSMAEAIFRGLIERKITQPQQIYVMNRQDQDKLNKIGQKYGVRVTSDLNLRETYIREANVVMLCMKPKDVESSFRDLQPLLNENQLLVSVIAGLSIAKMETLLQTQMPIVRTMPNTSSTIGLGATGISFSKAVSPEQQQLAVEMFKAVGIVSIVEESKIDIVTGISGSGPAYVYYFMEAMMKAAAEGGLSEEDARALTVQTILGAATMVQTTQEDPAELRKKVTSPNGTTQAALETLDRHQFSEGIVRAVFRAAERSKEMGEQIAAHK